MKTPTRTSTATKFRAKCGELLALVHKRGIEIVVTKRGKPVAKLVAVPETLRGIIKGRTRGDIVYVNLWEPVR